MSDTLPLFTDFTITPIDKGNLKKYFSSIKRNQPENWKLIYDATYDDGDTFKIIEEFCCLQTPRFKDLRFDRVLVGKIFLGLTDESILLLKIDLSIEIPKEEALEIIGYILHEFHENYLKLIKYYSQFKHQFEFRGPYDENWSRRDIRDSRLIRLHAKDDGKVYALSKSNNSSIRDKQIYYPDANNISLSLSIMKKSYKNALGLYKRLLKINSGKKIEIKDKNLPLLYDYFEEILKSIIFAYISVEAMSNAAIPETVSHEKINDKGVKEIWSKENIERWMSTSDKIVQILPGILKTTDVKLEPFWAKFKELESLRNRIVHQRTIQDGTKLNTEIYDEVLHATVFDKIKSALSIIQFFYNFENAHPYFPLGLGMAKFQLVEIESMKKHFKLLEDEQGLT